MINMNGRQNEYWTSPLYFLLLLVIWLSVEKMFSTEPIVAFLDCSYYIFWLHLWVNKNVDGV